MKNLKIKDLKKDTSYIQANIANSYIFFDKTDEITGLFSTPTNKEDIRIDINHINKDILFSFSKKEEENQAKQLRINNQKIWMAFSSGIKSDECINIFKEKVGIISPTLSIKEFSGISTRTIFYYEIDGQEEEKEIFGKYIKIKNIDGFNLKFNLDIEGGFKNTMSIAVAKNPSVSDKNLLLIDCDLAYNSSVKIKDLESKLKALSDYTYQESGMLSIINS